MYKLRRSFRLPARLFTLLFFGALFTTPSFAEPDFFGVKMKSEDFARNIALQENLRIPDFNNDRPGTDKSVYAYGYTSSFLGRGRGISFQVFNHSEKDISTERLFRECVLVTRDGRRFDRSVPEMEWRRDKLKAGEEATFNVSFPGVDLRKQDVQMIIFSFGLGETNIYLFPLKPSEPTGEKIERKAVEKNVKKDVKKDAAKNVQKEAPKPVAKKAVKEAPKAPASKNVVPKGASTPEQHPVVTQCLTPVRLVRSFFDSLAHRGKAACADCGAEAVPTASEEVITSEAPTPDPEVTAPRPSWSPKPPTVDKALEPVYPLVKSSQVIEGVRYNFGPDVRARVAQAELDTQENVYRERPWSLDNPDQLLVRKEVFEYKKDVLPRHYAEVVIVNRRYDFVVFNAGLRDGVTENRIVSIYRVGRRIGKVMTSKVRDKISAGLILPEWKTKDDIKVGDLVGLD